MFEQKVRLFAYLFLLTAMNEKFLLRSAEHKRNNFN